MLTLFFFILDRIFKKFALIGIIKDIFFFKFSLWENPGIAFSIPIQVIFFYFLLGVIFYWVVFYLIKSYQQGEIMKIFSLSLILVGGLSNLLDRLKYGVVIDYINFSFLAAFNLADLMILGGVVILIRKLILTKQKIKIRV
ncbi:signal peptidase II [Patescibacteria group bacterium]|nr:signal peptidase II [Patescibacteria group bacterium]